MTEILSQFREDELPPSRVDIARAVRSGRRRRRTRTGLVTCGVVLVLAAGGATAPTWLLTAPDHGVSPAASSPAAVPCDGGPLPAYTQGTAWQTFDPLIYEIDASGVAGYQVETYTTARYFQTLILTNAAQTRRVTVMLYATEGVPYYAMPHTTVPTPGPGATPYTATTPEPIDPAAGEPTEPVAGAPAYWLPDQQVPGAEYGLAWQWTLGGWALVTARALDPSAPKPETDGDPTELRAIAAQVASQLVLGSGTPVTSPFSMPVPGCTRVGSTSLWSSTKNDGTPFARFDLGFSAAGQSEPSSPLRLPHDTTPAITVSADTAALPGDLPFVANSNVDGYPAYDQGSFLVVYGSLAIEISTPGGPEGMNTAAPSFVDPRDLYHSVQLHPGATADPATWGPPIG